MSFRLRLLSLVLCSVLLGSSSCQYVRFLFPLHIHAANSHLVDHGPWDALLKKHVDELGMVDYQAFLADSTALNRYLTQLAANPPADSWSQPEQLAYWLNAYNAFTIQRVLRGYPVKSIKDLGGDKALTNTVWDQAFISLGGKKISLNDLEQRIIRRQFDDPRVHFALVCAAMSCPRLRREAYVGARLEQQLDAQGTHFVNNPAKNDLTPPAAPTVSAIFSFYPGDFNKDGHTIQEWINRYATTKIDPNAQLKYKPYDWSLNEQ